MLIDTALNLPTLMTLAGAIVGGIVWLVRLESRVNDAAHKVTSIQPLVGVNASQLSEFKVHVAETYVTKQGMNEQTKQIMAAIKDVADRVDSLGSRLDNIVDRK